MEKFCLKTLIANDIESELEKIGFDTAYRAKGADKFRYKTLKIFGLILVKIREIFKPYEVGELRRRTPHYPPRLRHRAP